MSSNQTAAQVLERHYLEIRAKILELAATLDRLDRAQVREGISHDPRMGLIRQGLEILQSQGADRAERFQMACSDPYTPDWLPEVKSQKGR